MAGCPRVYPLCPCLDIATTWTPPRSCARCLARGLCRVADGLGIQEAPLLTSAPGPRRCPRPQAAPQAPGPEAVEEASPQPPVDSPTRLSACHLLRQSPLFPSGSGKHGESAWGGPPNSSPASGCRELPPEGPKGKPWGMNPLPFPLRFFWGSCHFLVLHS